MLKSADIQLCRDHRIYKGSKTESENLLATMYVLSNLQSFQWFLETGAALRHFYTCVDAQRTCSFLGDGIWRPSSLEKTTTQRNRYNYNNVDEVTQARFPLKRNRLRCVRCVNENHKNRKRLRFLRFSFTQCTQRKRLRLNGNWAWVSGAVRDHAGQRRYITFG